MFDLKLMSAQSEHVPEIGEIIQASFNDPLSQYTAVGQPGYESYLHDVIADKSSSSKMVFVGLVEQDVAAFADVSVPRDGANFLTRIAVSAKYRGHGIAGQLLSQIHRAYGGKKEWLLDVFHTNTGALRLYKKLGFEVLATNLWISRYLGDNYRHSMSEPVVQSPNDPQYARYGFTKAQIGGYAVSIAGTAVRCHDTEAFLNGPLFAQIKDLYPKVDRAFIVVDEATSHSSLLENSNEVGRSYRMRGYL